MGGALRLLAGLNCYDVFAIPDWKALYPVSSDPPAPTARVSFDVLETGCGVVEGDAPIFTNLTGNVLVGCSSTLWASGVFHVAIRLLTPNGLKRLALCRTMVVYPSGVAAGPPDLSTVPIRLLLPHALQVNGAQYPLRADLPAGTVVELTVDSDAMVVRLRIGDWDSGAIEIVPPSLPLPLFPYFLFDAGDSFEVLPQGAGPSPSLSPRPDSSRRATPSDHGDG